MRLQKLVLIVISLVCGGIIAQGQEPNAKNLYFGYKPRTNNRGPVVTNRRPPARIPSSNRPSTPSSARPNNTTGSGPVAVVTGLPGTKVSIKLMRNGKTSNVAPNYAFRSGDKIRLHLATNFDGYVSVLNLGSSGNVNLLYPVEGKSNRVRPTADYQIPQGDGWIVFDRQTGSETVSVIMSANPIGNLADLNGSSDYFRKNKTSKDLYVQTVGSAIYAVCPEGALSETVGFSMILRHM